MNDIDTPQSDQLEVPEQIDRQYAGAFIVTESGEVVGALAGNDDIDDTSQITTFGGMVNGEDATAIGTVWRELQDKLGIELDASDITPLRSEASWLPTDEQWEMRHYFYVTIADDDLERLAIREGQDWSRITGIDDPLIPAEYQPVLAEIFQKLGLDGREYLDI